MKRRNQNGDYESDWQLIPDYYFKRWGSVQFTADDILPYFFKQSDFTFEVLNNDGYFSPVTMEDSFFYQKLSVFRTFVRVDAGYVDTDGTELPTNSTLFIGLVNEDTKWQADNVVAFNCKHIRSVFEEFPVDQVTGLGATQTATDLIFKIRDYVDANSIAVFQKYISLGAWNVVTTSAFYNMATTTSLQGLSCWEMMEKLAAAENYVVYVGKDGGFNFVPRSTFGTAVAYHFSGIGDSDRTYGHNIMKYIAIDTGVRKVYNRVKVQFDDDDTITSYHIKNESWAWGDSSSSFLYGVREYKYENTFLDTVTSATVATTIYNEFKYPSDEVEIDSKFVPQLDIFNRVSLTYQSVNFGEGYLWGYFDWGTGIWGASLGYNINIDNEEYKVIGIEHDLSDFHSRVKMKAVI
jgi:hypothetical protein